MKSILISTYLVFTWLTLCDVTVGEVTSHVLRTAKEIREENHRRAGTDFILPVALERAQVVYANNKWGVGFIADDTGPIYIKLPSGDREPIYTGNVISVEAVATSKHPYMLRDTKYEILSNATIKPDGIRTTVSKMSSLGPTVPFVKLVGTVSQVSYSPQYAVLEMTQDGDRCRVFVGPMIHAPRRIHPGQRIEICGAPSMHGRFPEMILYCETDESIRILDETAPPMPKSISPLASHSFDELRLGQWVSLKGRVNQPIDADHYLIDTGSHGCKVSSVSGYMVHPGEVIYVEGKITELENGLCVDSIRADTKLFVSAQPSLTESKVNKLKTQDLFRQHAVVGKLQSVQHDDDLVRLRLKDDGGAEFVATLPAESSELLSKRLSNAKTLLVQGILQDRAPPTFSVSQVEDFKVLNHKAAFHVWVLSSLLGVAGCIGALFVAWTATLRRTVAKRTYDLENALSRLRDTYEASRAAIAVVDEQGRILESNSKFPKIIGCSCEPGTSFDKLAQHLNDACDINETWRVKSTTIRNEPLVDEAFTLQLRSPSKRVVEVHSSPVLSPDMELVARRWAFHDITETKQLESNLIQAQKMDAIGRLSAGVAHDFNNLLMAVRGNLELAKLTTDDEAKQWEYLNAAEVGTDRAAEIVRQMLSYSRKSSLELQAGDVNEVISEMVTLLGRSFGANIVIETNLDDELWLADIDKTHIGQVIMNMCVNARDAFLEGRGRILISTSNIQTDDRECIHIQVRDNGSGMNGATLDKIFEPFFTTKETGKGSGLGLATSLGIVEQHAGQIVCESTVGCGSCFRIELPRSEATVRTNVAEDSDHPHGSSIVTKPTSADLGHILVVDDEESIRNIAQAILQRAGFRVSVASGGNAGLDLLERDRSITAVLLDLNMPGLSGIEILRDIRARFPCIPVVLSSGSLFAPKQFEDCPPDSFLSKPYRYQELIDTITTCSGSIRESAA